MKFDELSKQVSKVVTASRHASIRSPHPKGIIGAARDDRVRGALRTVLLSAGTQGYGWSPELSLKSKTYFWYTFEGLPHPERPELILFEI